MKKYQVTYKIQYTVEAQTEEEAREQAIAQLSEQTLGYNLDPSNLEIEEQ